MDARLDLRRELAKLLFGLCCALGGLAGLWWAITTAPPRLEPADVLHAVAVNFGTGFGAGVAIGMLLAGAVVRGRENRLRAAGRS